MASVERMLNEHRDSTEAAGSVSRRRKVWEEERENLSAISVQIRDGKLKETIGFSTNLLMKVISSGPGRQRLWMHNSSDALSSLFTVKHNL